MVQCLTVDYRLVVVDNMGRERGIEEWRELGGAEKCSLTLTNVLFFTFRPYVNTVV